MADMERRRAIFICAEKGGVGKTTFARALLEIYRGAEKQVAAFDADAQIGQLAKYYGTRTAGDIDVEQDPLRGVGFFDIRDRREATMLLNAVKTGAEIILVDMPGGAMMEIRHVLEDTAAFVSQYEEHGYEVVVVLVIEPAAASVQSVSQAVAEFGDAVKYVVVLNMMNARRQSDYEVHWEGSRGERVSRERGASVIEMGDLRETWLKVDEGRTRFGKVEESGLSLTDKVRVNMWLGKIEAQLKGTPLEA